MRVIFQFKFIFTASLLLAMVNVIAQKEPGDSLTEKEDSIWLLEMINPLASFNVPDANADSILKRLKKFPKFQTDSIQLKKNWLELQHGYVQYNMNFRSRIDTPYAENDIVQHTASGNFQFLVNNAIPINVLYFERQSNSALFRDFRDLTVSVNGPELQRIRMGRIKNDIDKKVRELQDNKLAEQMNDAQLKTYNLKQILNSPDIIGKLIKCKEKVMFIDERKEPSRYKDSVKSAAARFIKLYEDKESELKQLLVRADSIKQKYLATAKTIQSLKKMSSPQLLTTKGTRVVEDSLRKMGVLPDELSKYNRLLNSIKSLSVGRTSPDISPLSVKHINVKGLNAEFENDRYYLAVTAGFVDFRLREFIQRNSPQPAQFIYAARGGLGRKDGTHIYVTVFNGQRQVYSFNKPAVNITGTTLEVQHVIKKRHRIKAEIAQSSAPSAIISGAPAGDYKFNISNKSGRAYNVQWNSFFPKLQSRFDASFQHNGFNFVAFNSYRANAASKSWNIKYEQLLFGRQLRMSASLRKNDFENPYILQRYSSNTVFKTLQASFRRKSWPTLTLAYIPSSQYTVVDSQIYETRFQTVSATGSHQYKLGTAGANTQFFYSKFLNSASDTGFVYANANHFSFYQQINYNLHFQTLTVTYTKSPQFSLLVTQGGFGTRIIRGVEAELGFKVNVINQMNSKIGLYCRGRINLPSIGDFNLWYEDFYLPGTGADLFKNRQMNIGYTRRIK
ncbi:MAG: hypothetical protein ABWZ25_17260 [Chitinophagaceae bacterium]